MGIAVGDYQNNGWLDFVATRLSRDDYKVLYHNDGDANFTDVSYQAGHRAGGAFHFSDGATGSSTTTTTAGKTS